jgi:hypothetical protein
VSVSGNITGGNVLGGANVNATLHSGTTVSVTGTITGANINGTALSVSGNIAGANSNIATQTGTTLSVTGNVTGGNLITAGTVNAATHTGTLVSVTSNVTGGNIITAGQICSSGNITTGGIGSFTGSYIVIPVSTGGFEASVSTVGAFYYNTSFGSLRIRLSGGWTSV